MMFQGTSIYAFWGGRREGFDISAQRMAAMLDGLAQTHPAFEGWQRQAPNSSRWTPYGGRPRMHAGLVEVLKEDWGNTELDRGLVPDAGMTTRAWNGENSPRSASFRATIEGVNTTGGGHNLVTFPLQSRSVGDPTLICAETMSRALATVVQAWDAVWGTVRPADLWRVVPMPEGILRTGWITYLSAPLAARFVTPAGCLAKPGADGSLLILATKEVFDPHEPSHLAGAQAIQAALDSIQPISLDGE